MGIGVDLAGERLRGVLLAPVQRVGNEKHLFVVQIGQNDRRRGGQRGDVGLVGVEGLVEAAQVRDVLAEGQVAVDEEARQDLIGGVQVGHAGGALLELALDVGWPPLVELARAIVLQIKNIIIII